MRGNRYWMWLGFRLLLGVGMVAWAASYIGPGSGEKEFKKTLDAMKQVRSFRVAFTSNPGTQSNQMLWEVDCTREIVHHQEHLVPDTANPDNAMIQDVTDVAGREFNRQSDGSWASSKYASGSNRSQPYCRHLADGTDGGLFPRIATMIQRGIIQKGDKKTVNGVRCREWQVAMRGAPSGLEHDTVCLGLEDHLPYELTVDWEHSRADFSDYNTAIQFDLPEAAVQPASASSTSN